MKKLLIGASLALASLTASATTIHASGSFVPSEYFGPGALTAPKPNVFTWDVTYIPVSGARTIAQLLDATVTIDSNTWTTSQIAFDPTVNFATIGLGTSAFDQTGLDWFVTWEASSVKNSQGWVTFAPFGVDNYTRAYSQNYDYQITSVPVPASALLFGVGLVGAAAARRKQSNFIPA